MAKQINKHDLVSFQAYPENTPVDGRVNRIGTLSELGKMQLDPQDTRVFYEVRTLGSNPHVFTVTTESSLTKLDEKS